MAGTVNIRFITGNGYGGQVDTGDAHADADLTSSGSSQATSIAADGRREELCIISPIGDNVRVAFGSSPTATTSAGPIAYAGQANAYRVKSGDKVAIIVAT